MQRGELISRVTNDIDNITQMMQQSLSQALTAVLTVVGVLIMMLTISWQLTLVVLVSFPLMGVLFGVIGPRSQKAFGIQWRKVGRLNARVEESFSGHALVKVYGREASSREAFRAWAGLSGHWNGSSTYQSGPVARASSSIVARRTARCPSASCGLPSGRLNG